MSPLACGIQLIESKKADGEGLTDEELTPTAKGTADQSAERSLKSLSNEGVELTEKSHFDCNLVLLIDTDKSMNIWFTAIVPGFKGCLIRLFKTIATVLDCELTTGGG